MTASFHHAGSSIVPFLQLVKVCTLTMMRGQPPGLSSHPKALDLNGAPSLWKGNATCAPAPYIMSIVLNARQSEEQTHEKPAQVCKEWGCLRLLWKSIWPILESLRKPATFEGGIALLQHLERELPVSRTRCPYAIECESIGLPK